MIAAPAPAPALAQDACANAATAATVAPPAEVSAAVRCLVNHTRAARGLATLGASERLRLAAARHATDMINRRYFAHVSPGGGTLTDRVARTGYLADAPVWALGENLGWGTGELSTPASILEAWMHSPGHRAVILNRRYRDVGIAVVPGVPTAVEGPGATYVLDAGVTD